MTKEKFLLICEFYKAIELRQQKIEQALECTFDGYNNSAELTYNFLFNLLKEENIDESSICYILDSVTEISYNGFCYYYTYTNKIMTQEIKCDSFEKLYDLIF